MPLFFTRENIVTMRVDAVVNAANERLAAGGGVCGAIFRAAGAGLSEECAKIGHCDTGDAVMTNGFGLPARIIIHTVGPVWYGGTHAERELLRSCYEKSVRLAIDAKLSSIAFPLISAGIFGYPFAEAVKVAVAAIGDTLANTDSDLCVYLSIFGGDNMTTFSECFDINTAPIPALQKSMRMHAKKNNMHMQEIGIAPQASVLVSRYESIPIQEFDEKQETFSQMLLRLIDESGRSDADVYHAANVDRKLFSKIRSSVDYSPSKTTAIAFTIALELTLEEAEKLLNAAGYTLSMSKNVDIVVISYIKRKVYSINDINMTLFARGLPLLGC